MRLSSPGSHMVVGSRLLVSLVPQSSLTSGRTEEGSSGGHLPALEFVVVSSAPGKDESSGGQAAANTGNLSLLRYGWHLVVVLNAAAPHCYRLLLRTAGGRRSGKGFAGHSIARRGFAVEVVQWAPYSAVATCCAQPRILSRDVALTRYSRSKPTTPPVLEVADDHNSRRV